MNDGDAGTRIADEGGQFGPGGIPGVVFEPFGDHVQYPDEVLVLVGFEVVSACSRWLAGCAGIACGGGCWVSLGHGTQGWTGLYPLMVTAMLVARIPSAASSPRTLRSMVVARCSSIGCASRSMEMLSRVVAALGGEGRQGFTWMSFGSRRWDGGL